MERLETERLILRPFRRADVAALLALYRDREVNAYLPWFPLDSLEEAEALYEREYAQPRDFRWAVCQRGRDVPEGYVHLAAEEPYELGYALARRLWGQGLATEAARAAPRRA